MSQGRAPAVVDAGAAWFDRTWSDPARKPAAGAVCGVFRRAAYLRFGGQILAVCRPGVEPGPLHLRLDRLPGLTVGQAVWLGAGRLHVAAGAGTMSLDLGTVRRWTPGPVDASALRSAMAVRADGPPSSGLAPTGLPEPLVEAAARLLAGGGDLTALARLVGGRGPGLTPAGDDLLAGALVADASLRPSHGAARRLAADTARTNDVAAAFLRWAAAGQCIKPLHDVVEALVAADPAHEAAARVRLGRIGASSGAALLLGLDLVLAAETARAAA